MIACEGESKEDDIDVEVEVPSNDKKLKVNLNSSSMVGIDSPKTMKFPGEIRGKNVLVLLDSEATHNFLSKMVVVKLSILVSPTQFSVVLGDNRKIKLKNVKEWN